jgi:hypothetical protein
VQALPRLHHLPAPSAPVLLPSGVRVQHDAQPALCRPPWSFSFRLSCCRYTIEVTTFTQKPCPPASGYRQPRQPLPTPTPACCMLQSAAAAAPFFVPCPCCAAQHCTDRPLQVEIHDGPYNKIKNWDYVRLIEAMQNGEGPLFATRVRGGSRSPPACTRLPACPRVCHTLPNAPCRWQQGGGLTVLRAPGAGWH